MEQKVAWPHRVKVEFFTPFRGARQPEKLKEPNRRS